MLHTGVVLENINVGERGLIHYAWHVLTETFSLLNF